MPLPGQPPPSPALLHALRLLAKGRAAEADDAVTLAAKQAKGHSGSGSHPLACAYADMARLHYQAGNFKRAALEFKHAGDGPVPPDPAARADRLAFMLGFAGCLDALNQPADAERVFRQCAAFARNLHGPATLGYAAALEPLAELLLRTGNSPEAARLMDEAYGVIWQHGGRAITTAMPLRAEALRAVGRADDPFADLADLPDELVAEVVANAAARSGVGDGVRVREALAALVTAVVKRYGDGHPRTTDALAAVVRHETALGAAGDDAVRAAAVRRAVWAAAVQRLPASLLADLDVRFEPGGALHLAPRLLRDPSASEAAQLEAVLTEAADALYARPAKPAE